MSVMVATKFRPEKVIFRKRPPRLVLQGTNPDHPAIRVVLTVRPHKFRLGIRRVRADGTPVPDGDLCLVCGCVLDRRSPIHDV